MSALLIELETRVAARPEIVFEYFVQPELYRRWKGPTLAGPYVDNCTEPVRGPSVTLMTAR